MANISYSAAERQDSINAFMSMLIDFDQVAPNMISATSLQSFVIWFEKCMSIDKRCTFLFIRKYLDKFDADHIFFAQRYFKVSFGEPSGAKQSQPVAPNPSGEKSKKLNLKTAEPKPQMKKGLNLHIK